MSFKPPITFTNACICIMKISRSFAFANRSLFQALALGLLWVMLIECCLGGKTTTIVHHTETTNPQADGFWTNKTTWSSRWVKYWKPKSIYVPIWKKVWTPTIHNEWVPLPNVPSAWEKKDH